MLRQYSNFARIFDFGNGLFSDNILFSFSMALWQLELDLLEIHKNQKRSRLVTNQQLKLNIWYFISVTLKNNQTVIYLNGASVASGTINIPNNITRKFNYIGKSYGGFSSDSKISNLKISTELLVYPNLSLNKIKMSKKL